MGGFGIDWYISVFFETSSSRPVALRNLFLPILRRFFEIQLDAVMILKLQFKPERSEMPRICIFAKRMLST